MSRGDYRLVTTTRELASVVEHARSARQMGLDTEFLRERTYRARLCLVQIAVSEKVWLVDPLAHVDLAPVAGLVSDPAVEVVVHAGRQDLELLHEAFGVVPRAVFDVQVAGGFAGYGSSPSYGGVVESALGVRLTKGESYTNWCVRPLTAEQLRYAADDVRFLVRVAHELKTTLRSLGRLEWATEEMCSLVAPESYRADPGEAWRRVGGRAQLTPSQLGVLREVARWREEEAARRDIPRGWVLKDPTLIEIARRAPKTTSALKAIRGLNPREAERSSRQILAAVEHGRQNPIDRAPSPARSVLVRARTLAGIADAVVRARCERAGIASDLVATRTELESLLADVASGRVDESRHRMLTGWRRELAGEAVLALAAGRLAVRCIDRPPYIEEIAL